MNMMLAPARRSLGKFESARALYIGYELDLFEFVAMETFRLFFSIVTFNFRSGSMAPRFFSVSHFWRTLAVHLKLKSSFLLC
jgi:hypothetical protein